MSKSKRHHLNHRASTHLSVDEKLNQLAQAFNQAYAGLTSNLTARDKELMLYFAAFTYALAKAFPDKFTDAIGQPINIVEDFMKNVYPHLMKEAAEESPTPVINTFFEGNGDKITINTGV